MTSKLSSHFLLSSLLCVLLGCNSATKPGGMAAGDDSLNVPKLQPRPLVWIEDREGPRESSAARQAAERLTQMADLLKASEEFQRAETNYQKAIEADPTWGYPVYQLACNYELWNKPEQAVEQFKKSIEVGFDDFPTALTDDELGRIRQRADFDDDLRKIRERYIAASADQVGQPIAVRPEGEPSADGWPVMMLLHGYGDTNLSYLDNARGWAKAGFVAIAVPGSVPARQGRFVWSNDSVEPTHSDLKQILMSPLLAGKVDKRRVYLLGFSQGALHAMLLTAEHPDEFAGVVGLSPGGSLAEQLIEPQLKSDPQRLVRCVFIHGDEEPHGPIVGIWSNACNKAGWRFMSKTHPGGHHFPEDWDATRSEIAQFLLN